MSNLPLGDELKALFEEVTMGKREGAPVRAILVQNDNGMLRLIDSLPEEGTDKEDFNNVLGKLFSKEPSKSGYALYRLDSKSPAGLYEWLNCAYRPEGAKVREKMQYSITQASLFEGLNEQHFLETVYGGTTAEFAFPSKLRNQRKHDYQNPQQSTAGKKAAEAAGTGTAGRRNFDKIPSPTPLPQRPTENTRKVSSPVEPVKASSISGVTQHTSANSLTQQEKQPEVAAPPAPAPAPAAAAGLEEKNKARAKEEDETIPTEEASREERNETASSEGVDGAEGASSVPTNATKAAEQSDTASSLKPPQDASPLASAEESEEKKVMEKEKEEVLQESIAPSSDPALTEARVQEEPKTPAESAVTPTPSSTVDKGAESDSAVAKKGNGTASVAATGLTAATTSVGTGKGSQGLETEREKHLAKLRGEEEKVKSSGSQGGSHIGFPWQTDVEPALNGLAKKLGGTSEWNLVILKIDLANEEIQLSGQPRFVPPGDLAEALPAAEPCYAFYSHPDVQTQSEGGSQVTVVYVCPPHSSVRQRMLYSANLALTCNRVGVIQGIQILKRIETSDPREVTADFLTEELLGDSNAETGQAKALSRPKRPGRR